MKMMMKMMESAGLELLVLPLMLCFSLMCGFGPLCVIRRATGVRLRVVSLASCLSGGVFLSSCVLELLPEYLTHARQTFSRIGLTLHFPLAEFILAMGFLVVLVAEQMLLAFRDPAGAVPQEKQALMEPDAPGRSRWRRLSCTDGAVCPEDGKWHVGLRVFLLALCVCVRALLEGLRVGWQRDPELLLQMCVTLLLQQGILAFSLSVRLIHDGLRRAVVSGCLLLFCVTGPAGIGIGLALAGTDAGARVQLVRCAVEGLTSGVFMNVCIGGLLWQEPASPKHRVHKVAFLLAGFALVTAVLFRKV